MTNRAWGDDWSDPVLNGVEQATRLADAFVRQLDGPLRAVTTGGPQQLRKEAERASDRALAAIVEALDAYANLASPSSDPASDDPTATTVVTWSGASADPFQIWLHNTTSTPSPTIRLHTTPLCDHQGRALDVKVDSDPADGLILRPGESLCVAVTLMGDRPDDGGTFHGVLLAEGLPGAAIPLRLEVLR